MWSSLGSADGAVGVLASLVEQPVPSFKSRPAAVQPGG